MLNYDSISEDRIVMVCRDLGVDVLKEMEDKGDIIRYVKEIVEVWEANREKYLGRDEGKLVRDVIDICRRAPEIEPGFFEEDAYACSDALDVILKIVQEYNKHLR